MLRRLSSLNRLHGSKLRNGTERLQVTAWLAPLGLTVAVNCCTPPAVTVTLEGETLTPVGGGGGLLAN